MLDARLTPGLGKLLTQRAAAAAAAYMIIHFPHYFIALRRAVNYKTINGKG